MACGKSNKSTSQVNERPVVEVIDGESANANGWKPRSFTDPSGGLVVHKNEEEKKKRSLIQHLIIAYNTCQKHIHSQKRN